jgi:glutamate/tyrosine decarboxylase-like PLP-dependent enzyme
VVVKSEVHGTIPRALRYLGLGHSRPVEVASDRSSRIVPERLEEMLRTLEGPTIVCVEAGNVNTGSFDAFAAVADAVDAHRGRGNPSWVHVDGAIALWARASAAVRASTVGLERFDSWSTDAHKLLTSPMTPASRCAVTAPHTVLP